MGITVIKKTLIFILKYYQGVASIWAEIWWKICFFSYLILEQPFLRSFFGNMPNISSNIKNAEKNTIPSVINSSRRNGFRRYLKAFLKGVASAMIIFLVQSMMFCVILNHKRWWALYDISTSVASHDHSICVLRMYEVYVNSILKEVALLMDMDR